MADYEYGNDAQYTQEKSLKGYRIIIIVLAVILGALSFIYFNQMNSIKKEYAIERDTLTNRLSNLLLNYDNLETENQLISHNLDIERDKADSLLNSLTNERNLNRQKVRQYERQLSLMRAVQEGYIKQIDSLNTLNRQLAAENVGFRQQISSERLRADMAEERMDEMNTRIQKGSVVRARDVYMFPLNKNDKEVSKANRSERLRVDFVLTANELANPGARTVYVRIKGPDGYILSNPSNAMFQYEGEMLTFSAARDIDYQNNDLNVSIYYSGSGIVSGLYAVEIFMDGRLIGSTEQFLK